MTFDEAIRSHTFWKVTLRWLVNGQKALDVTHLGDDRACELGAWIAAEQDRFARYPAFPELLAAHAAFHRLAAEVAHLAGQGETDAARALLADDGAFTQASARTVAALRGLAREAGASP